MDINVTILAGRLTKDPELKTTTSGTNITNFSLAVNHTDDLTSFFEIVCFGKTAEHVAKYVQKGRQVIVSGRLQQRSWEAKDGTRRYAIEVIANQVQFVGSSEQSAKNAHSSDVVLEDIDDKAINLSELDIPF